MDQFNIDDLTQWPGRPNAQDGFDEANIDPTLRNMGSWPNSQESDKTVATVQQAAHDVDRSVNDGDHTAYGTTNHTQTPSTYSTPAAFNGPPWQEVQTSRQRYPIRQQQHMLPTPDTSSISHQRGENASAYHQNTLTWQTNNPYGVLNVDTTHGLQHEGFAGGNTINEYGNVTPLSQHADATYFDEAYLAPSPLAGRGPAQDPYLQPMQEHIALAGSVHGWQHANVPPTEAMYTWAQGAYNVGDVDNVPAPALHPLPTNTTKGKKKASVRSNRTTGTLICEHPGCNKRYDKKNDLDHHARIHDPNNWNKLCSICGKKSLWAKDLKRHMKTHETERHIFCNRLNCPFRTKGFKRQDHLDRHMRTQHKEEDESGA